jgi:competence ComEA-like helix-hairpin-helix protein
MPRPERRALLLLLALAVAGQAVRHLATKPGEAPGQVQLLATLPPGSPSAQRDSAMHRARPLGSGERIDVESADIGELSRLPRVGLGLAKTIIADRKAHGPFGSLEGLDRVPGVGRGLLKVLGPHVAFSGAPTRWSGSSQSNGEDGAPPDPLNINTAGITELDALPGIGPARAAAILHYREAHGPFAAVEQLVRVPGFGPAALARVKDRITAR